MLSADIMSGPTAFYPPPPTTEYFPHTRAHCISYSPSPEPPQMRRPPLTQQRSRKRSRDQLEEDEREAAFAQENTMDTSGPTPEPIYGEGMVLLDPNTMRPIGNDASSSTGTWRETELEAERRATAVAAEQLARDQDEMARATNRPSKASRLDLSNVNASSKRSGSPSTTPGLVAPAPLTPETPSAPAHDEAAMTLGVGWRKVDASLDVALAGASKGWAKFIDNHFAQVSAAEIIAINNNKGAYLVKACDLSFGRGGYFLFSDKLTEGQLLSHDIDGAIRNVQTGRFEGALMAARSSPEPASHAAVAASVIATEVAMEM